MTFFYQVLSSLIEKLTILSLQEYLNPKICNHFFYFVITHWTDSVNEYKSLIKSNLYLKEYGK